MSDAVVCVKCPNENLKAFNKRVEGKCSEVEVTDFKLLVVDGQPVVVLIAGQVEADEEDVAAAKEEGEELKVGELIPEDTPLIVQVCALAALIPPGDPSDKNAVAGDSADSERRSDAVCQRANDRIVRTESATGTFYDWVADYADPKKKQWLPRTRTFLAIAYEPSDEAAPAKPAPAPANG